MQYQSTRNKKLTAAAARAVLDGPAPDGGLYVLPSFPAFDWKHTLTLPAQQAAVEILSALLPDYSPQEMAALVQAGYAGKFETEDLTPTVPVGEDYVLELFRGPTSAFKDVALSMLPQLLTAARKKCGVSEDVLILTATSGDTGKAAMEGFRDVPGTRILVFYPAGGVSAVQEQQMVTQEGKNVRVCAVRGNFDDAQTGVKRIFTDAAAKNVRLSSANSINIGRLAPQVVYYFLAYAKLVQSGRIRVGDPVDFAVPTGNFGDILAGRYAKQLGLPVGTLICASNANNVLTEFLQTGRYDRRRAFYRTLSPSMDILVSSNLERLLYHLAGEEATAAWMRQLSENGYYDVTPEVLAKLQKEFACAFCDDAQTKQTVGAVWNGHHYLMDTHTAVAWYAAQQYKREHPDHAPVVVLSTASPYKFPRAVLEGLGVPPEGDDFAVMEQLNRVTGVPIPRNLAGLREKPVLHRDVIDPEEMLEYVLKIAACP